MLSPRSSKVRSPTNFEANCIPMMGTSEVWRVNHCTDGIFGSRGSDATKDFTSVATRMMPVLFGFWEISAKLVITSESTWDELLLYLGV